MNKIERSFDPTLAAEGVKTLFSFSTAQNGKSSTFGANLISQIIVYSVLEPFVTR